MNGAILNKEVQDFIREKQDENPSLIALAKSPFPDVTSRELAEQIDSRKRCERKLPLWFNTPEIYYPPKLGLEQASSEQTALFKASLVTGKTMIDLTGGFGVDDYYFSKKFEKVIHCERNEELSAIAKHNAVALKADNLEFINSANSLERFSQINGRFDVVYIDPSRRVKSQKVFKLADCEPDVPSNFDLLLDKSEKIIIKTSPLLDIQAGLKELRHVSQVYVISIKNDCKELLWIIDKTFNKEAEIIAVALADTPNSFSFHISKEKAAILSGYTKPGDYLYDPDVALLKAGAFKSIAIHYQLQKLDQHTHIYTSNKLDETFIGRIFKVEEVIDYKNFTKSVTRANVIARNFPASVDELKKKFRITDGGSEYLYFTTAQSRHVIIRASRIK
ncbi:hypothetical protein GS399_04705 [Pedobacter sp. HMF7647]|uniref:THUMP-like domain-containing protein n=1 Tax=Hufsiella arboris TaxID=2695275 RepID=A0A7K1Y6R2_9SPHI|nr:class I SAM-dependent methyltransferase [Hufsiella arboris]MXV50262.1 hypothetical protein [Hufsiella arboris]